MYGLKLEHPQAQPNFMRSYKKKERTWFLVRLLSLFTLMAVKIARDKTFRGLLIHDCYILVKNRGKIASSFEQVRNSCDIAVIKSR